MFVQFFKFDFKCYAKLVYFCFVGNPTTWAILKAFECARMSSFEHKDFAFYRLRSLASRISQFLILLDLDLHKNFYDGFNRLTATQSKIELQTNVAGFGKSSIDYEASILSSVDGGSALARLQSKHVLMDMTKRKPLVIPETIKESLQSYLKHEGQSFRYKPSPNLDGHSLLMSMPVNASDTDIRAHLSHSSFVKLCMDAATEACFEDKFQHFSGDLALYHVKNLKALYKKECNMGEVMNVYCKEKLDPERVLQFVLTKNDSDIVTFYCDIAFYAKE